MFENKLITACKYGQTRTARLILIFRFLCNIKATEHGEKYGDTGFDLALNNNQLDVVRLFVKIDREYEFQALIRGSKDIIESLIQDGADINQRSTNHSGCTPLMTAAKFGRSEAIETLLKNRADLKTTDKNGKIAFVSYLGTKAPEIIRIFLGQGADINESNEDGETALILNSRCGLLSYVEKLIQHGADLDAVDNDGYDALMWVLKKKNGDFKIANALIKGGINLKKVDNNGRSALWLLLFNSIYKTNAKKLFDHFMKFHKKIGNLKGFIPDFSKILSYESYNDEFTLKMVREVPKMLTLLINKGADTNIKLGNGMTLLMMLSMKEFDGHSEFNDDYLNEVISEYDKIVLEVVKLLIQNGADKDSINDDDETALDIAKRKGNDNIVDLLKSAKSGPVKKTPNKIKEFSDTDKDILDLYLDGDENRSWAVLKGYDQKTAYKEFPDYDVAYIRAAGPIESEGVPGSWDNEILLEGLNQSKLKSKLLLHLASNNIFQKKGKDGFVQSIQAFNSAKHIPPGPGPYVYVFFYLFYVFKLAATSNHDVSAADLIAMNSPGIEISSRENSLIKKVAQETVKQLENQLISEGEKIIRSRFKKKKQAYDFPSYYDE